MMTLTVIARSQKNFSKINTVSLDPLDGFSPILHRYIIETTKKTV